MKIFVCLLVVLALRAVPVMGQTGDPSFPVAGTVIKVSPVFVREDGDVRIVMLPPGAAVHVLGTQGYWYTVVFSSPQGDLTGEMQPRDIRIDPDAAALAPGSGMRTVSQRGVIEGRGVGFAQPSPTNTRRVIGDALIRQELFLRPARWLQFSFGADLRASSDGEVGAGWTLALHDRDVRRPRVSIRRFGAAVTTRNFSLDLGKQFIRWGRADILSPVDRFAPRDYLNVLDSEFLPVVGARASLRAGGETFELVWLPEMTPSRLPLLGKRWTVVPPEAAALVLEDQGSVFPDESQYGARWSHAGRFEMALSFFDGFNHLPDITAEVDSDLGVVAVTRTHAALRTYGAELSVPTPAFTLKGEVAYFTSPTSSTSEYVLYVIEAERQAGEWLLDVGYAGEVVIKSLASALFAAERGVARSIIGRASYTIDPRRSLEIEAAVRQNGAGLYAKGEFSQAFGRHLRLTLAAVGIRGNEDDFLGQYRRNSHALASLRLSY